MQQCQCAVEGLVRRLEGGGQPGSADRATAFPQPGVDHEQDEEVAVSGGVPSGEERGVVAAAQVAPQPEH